MTTMNAITRLLRITTEDRVIRMRWTRYSRRYPRSSGFCEAQGQQNRLIRIWKLCGITIWAYELDREEIPNYVWIDHTCFGSYYGNWKSKFQHIIDQQEK